LLAPTASQDQLLLVNPHPDTWNNWQFPYAALASSVSEDTSCSSFERLEKALRDVADLSSQKILGDAEKEITEQLGTSVSVTGKLATESYALRFSQSADVWTGYRFAYVVGAIHDPDSVKHATHWIDIPHAAPGNIPSSVQGVVLSDNVASVLFKDAVALREIRTAVKNVS
jgi:hypothetical protein